MADSRTDGHAPALIAQDLVRTFGTWRVLDGVSITASPGDRIGLVGENGAGKSTLLRLLAGVEEPHSGTVLRPAELGFLHQELPFAAEQTVADVLDDALREARDDLAELDRLTSALAAEPDDRELLTQYGDRLDEAQRRQAWDADRRAAIVLSGLGLGDLQHERRLGTLSGGQRGRLALAALLVRRPMALLLDEPTNHLDDAAASFLEDELRGMPGVVVAASHDRAFLDAVCTDLIDLDPAVDGPVRYGGNYTAYQGQKQAERDRWRRRYDEERAELARLRVAVAETGHDVAPGRLKRDTEKMGFGHTAGRVQNQISRRIRSAAARLDALERDQTPEPPDPLRFHAPLTRPAGERTDPLISLRDIHVPGRTWNVWRPRSTSSPVNSTGNRPARWWFVVRVQPGMTADAGNRQASGVGSTPYGPRPNSGPPTVFSMRRSWAASDGCDTSMPRQPWSRFQCSRVGRWFSRPVAGF